ncbi:MAG: M61 family metallopeptidase [Gammaproteobacteria bacterium]
MTTNIEEAGIVYDVRPADPGAHVFDVTCRVGQPDAGGQEFSLPAWIPGSYMIRDYARHVMTVSAECDGEEVALRKLDKSTWHAAECDGPLLIRARIYAYDISVRGAYLDFDHGFFNGVCLFFLVHGKEHERCVVHLGPPDAITGAGGGAADWTVATSMDRLTGERDDFGAFVAMGYDELIDHPVLMGSLDSVRFELAGAEHQVALVGRHDADMDRLREDIQLVCSTHVDMFGGKLPLDRYVFLVTVVNRGYGGLEHCNSSALICGRDDLPSKGQTSVSTRYRQFLGLVSHEYFHLWNVKRIRPAEFVPYPLDREAYTRQLWVFEGITSYYDDLGLLRSGLVDADSYLDLLGQSLTVVYRAVGRRRQTLEESSFDAWIKFYKQDENSPNAIVSYYRKGAMVALALDLELRMKSEGTCSLDEVMRVLWENYGAGGIHGLPEDGFELLAEEVSGLHLGEFFKQSLRTTVDPPVGILLAQFGVRLNMRAAESELDRGGKRGQREERPRPWLGLRTRDVDNTVRIAHVLHDSAAAQAGLSANDELVALNEIRVTTANWNELVDRLEIGATATLCVFRRDELRHVDVEVAMPPRDTCYLTLEADVESDVAERRQAWLGV